MRDAIYKERKRKEYIYFKCIKEEVGKEETFIIIMSSQQERRRKMEKEKAEVALMVATKFVENFYPVLADTPYMLHNFYHESARFTFTIGSDVRFYFIIIF